MAKIYSQATEVIIWLGEKSEGSEEVMLYLRRVGQKFVDRGGEILEPRNERSLENDKIWEDMTNDPNLEKTHLFWQRPWFSRRWVLEEMALARNPIVHYGAVSMEWNVLFHACTALSRLRGDGSHFWNKTTGKPLRMQSKPMLNALKLDDIRKGIWVMMQSSLRDKCLNAWMMRGHLSAGMPMTEFSRCWVFSIMAEKIPFRLITESRRLKYSKPLRGTASGTEILSASCHSLARSTTRQSKDA
jgi:hypothetical protein